MCRSTFLVFVGVTIRKDNYCNKELFMFEMVLYICNVITVTDKKRSKTKNLLYSLMS